MSAQDLKTILELCSANGVQMIQSPGLEIQFFYPQKDPIDKGPEKVYLPKTIPFGAEVGGKPEPDFVENLEISEEESEAAAQNDMLVNNPSEYEQKIIDELMGA